MIRKQIPLKDKKFLFSRDFQNLKEVLCEVENGFAYKRGGGYGLETAIKAATVTTVELDSGLQISGVLAKAKCVGEHPYLLEWKGKVQLCLQDI